jgi:hypothetical protein
VGAHLQSIAASLYAADGPPVTVEDAVRGEPKKS